ncbi:MAG: dephospho-CoA kinase [Acetatifactor sp.]|nr:dephospho-CoA kinase [Acetatifactor sp.]MDE7113199.1 dephospho-CoA kinase [Acetatifactor sp.]
MRFIGITGGVGAGKSKLLAYIKSHYLCEIYLADEVAHLVKAKGTSCYEMLIDLLGEGILQEDGEIDRGAMAERIFGDEVLLEQVNAIIHPAVQEYLLQRLAEARKNPEVELFFVEAALLIEAGYKELADELWYVYAGEAVRRERLAESRQYSPEKIANIMENQLSEEQFREHCDFVIDNSGRLEDSFRQIDKKLEAFSWRD